MPLCVIASVLNQKVQPQSAVLLKKRFRETSSNRMTLKLAHDYAAIFRIGPKDIARTAIDSYRPPR